MFGNLEYKNIKFDFILDEKKLMLYVKEGQEKEFREEFFEVLDNGVYTYKDYQLTEQYLIGKSKENFATVVIIPKSSSANISILSDIVTIDIEYVIYINPNESISRMTFYCKELEYIYNWERAIENRNFKINGEVNDKTAKVSGLGEVDVKEGLNEFNIVVTAENGTTKTYVLKVTVPEKDPIMYKFKNGEFNILRKLPEALPTNFVSSTIKFNEEDVTCLKNETLDLTLLYLRDGNNKDGFYIYDEVNNEVTYYNELGSNDFKIYLTNKEIVIKNLEKKEITINDVKVIGYRLTKDSNNYVISGRNISTGKDGIYLYDSVNKTISLFNQSDYDNLINTNKLYIYVSIGLGVCVLVLLLALILVNNSKNKLSKVFIAKQEEMVNQINKDRENKVNNKKKNKKFKEKDETLDNEQNDSKDNDEK